MCFMLAFSQDGIWDVIGNAVVGFEVEGLIVVSNVVSPLVVFLDEVVVAFVDFTGFLEVVVGS